MYIYSTLYNSNLNSRHTNPISVFLLFSYKALLIKLLFDVKISGQNESWNCLSRLISLRSYDAHKITCHVYDSFLKVHRMNLISCEGKWSFRHELIEVVNIIVHFVVLFTSQKLLLCKHANISKAVVAIMLTCKNSFRIE